MGGGDTPGPTPPTPSPVVNGLRVLGEILQQDIDGEWVEVSFNGKQVLATYNDKLEGITIGFSPSPVDSSTPNYNLVTNNVRASSGAVIATTTYSPGNGLIIDIGELSLSPIVEGDSSPYIISG